VPLGFFRILLKKKIARERTGHASNALLRYQKPSKEQTMLAIYLSIFQYSKPLRMRIISWGQQNIHVANPKKKLIIINYLKLKLR
jgi:hypothetical protein